LVKRGGTVQKGQVIARVGSTGGVSRPQLHFELRKGSTAVDPRKYLPAV
jgi:murein DD-endopeptidase MepM/ murein hydrolase activator NlpD